MKNKKSLQRLTVQTVAYSALLAAVSVVLARLLSFAPVASVRWSADKFPLFLAGVFFGPVVGGMVGLVADVTGCLLSPYGINPILSLPAILYGVFGGTFRYALAKKMNGLRLVAIYAIPVVLGSVLYQSAALAWCYSPTTFWQAFSANLISRSVQFGVMLVLETAILFLLFRSKLFERAGLWPPTARKQDAPITNVEQALEFIHSVCWKGSIPGLERTQELLSRMGDPHNKLKFVHIAGTNGKGSTAAMTASILQKAGYRVGLYTSPYIYRFNERMQINGTPISDRELTEITAWVKPLAQTMDDSPTEFELVSCIAFEYFLRGGCDIVVLEVGMGGSWDSTNVIAAPEVAVITNIGLDHTDVLGDTVEKIALTKAGIIKPGCHVVIYPNEPAVETVLQQACDQNQVMLTRADFESLQLRSCGLEGQVFDCGSRKGLTLPLLGQHQLYNAAVVLAVTDVLIRRGWQITEENIRDGLAQVRWPGRFDVMCKKPLFVIDGGHNPQCIDALAKNMQQYLGDQKITVLTGVLADKDYAQMYAPVMPLVEEFVCITPPNPRRLDAKLLAQYLTEKGAKATACETVEDGVKLALEKAGGDGAVVCFGSLYSIGAIRDALQHLGIVDTLT